jgi:hypothetical protein
MGQAVGRLAKQQGVFRPIRINESSEVESELVDFLRGRFFTREAESCARGHAIVVVAEAALGFFEDRIEFLREEVFCVRG